MTKKTTTRALYWFRNDLRIDDNPALNAMTNESQSAAFLFVIDTRWLGESQQHPNRMGRHRLRFMMECLADLQQVLLQKGHQLIVVQGDPATRVLQVANDLDCSAVFAQKEHTQEEIQDELQIVEKIAAQWIEGTTLIHPDDLPMAIDHLPEVFSRFRNKVEKKGLVIRPISSVASWPATVDVSLHFDPHWPEQIKTAADSLPHPKTLVFKGGTVEAWKRINTYFWDRKSLSHYKQTRNGLLGWDYSSKLSPWIAWGCISARQVHAEVLRYEEKIIRNENTYWLIFELLWRDYFRFVAMQNGNRIWRLSGLKESASKVNPQSTTHDLEKWMNGQTSDDFINANMRELKATGFMSNRGRQNVASFAVHDMGLDWRDCAAWFECQLIDFDPCSNTMNWLYVAGLGNDPRPSRKFDVPWQTERYDPQGEYRTFWNKTFTA